MGKQNTYQILGLPMFFLANFPH